MIWKSSKTKYKTQKKTPKKNKKSLHFRHEFQVKFFYNLASNSSFNPFSSLEFLLTKDLLIKYILFYNYVHKRTGPISTWGAEACCLKIFYVARIFQNEPTAKPCLQQNCAYIFYAILKWHRNGYKQNNINWQYIKSKSAELFFSQIPGYEKIKISARKIEMLLEKIDDVRIWAGFRSPPAPPVRTPMITCSKTIVLPEIDNFLVGYCTVFHNSDVHGSLQLPELWLHPVIRPGIRSNRSSLFIGFTAPVRD